MHRLCAGITRDEDEDEDEDEHEDAHGDEDGDEYDEEWRGIWRWTWSEDEDEIVKLPKLWQFVASREAQQSKFEHVEWKMERKRGRLEPQLPKVWDILMIKMA